MEAITDLTYILTAFAGGVFGEALGCLAAFILCGFWIVAGELIVIAGGPDWGDSYIDPPALAITACTILVVVFL